MRGSFDSQPVIIAYFNLEKRVPQDHPLRKIKPMVDQELKRLSPHFGQMYSHTGRPSIPPERVLKSLLWSLWIRCVVSGSCANSWTITFFSNIIFHFAAQSG
jgi:transposase